MSVANSKKTQALHACQFAGAVARIRRGGSTRAGRRSALLGVLTSYYANSSRGARSGEPRTPTPSSDRS